MTPIPLPPPKGADWMIDEIRGGPHTLKMMHVSLPDVLAANTMGDPSPWWAHVWPAGEELAKRVLAGERLDGLRCLDLGCGSGIVGVALGVMGAEVTFADSAPKSLELARDNAERNGVAKFHVRQLDWDEPDGERYQRVYASDVLYEASQIVPFVAALGSLLEPEGIAYVADPKRQPLKRLFSLLKDAGFAISYERDDAELMILRLQRTWA